MEDFAKKKPLFRKCSVVSQSFKVKEERIATVKKVAAILQKAEINRTQEESDILRSCSDIVKEVNLRQQKRDKVKARLEEVEDPPDVLEEKCIRLAAAIVHANSLTVYTGAGISTAASIPDYRGTNGVWTRMQQGKDIGNHDLSLAEPTITHMALYSLYKSRILKYVVSQNCDGLHLRSGIPRNMLSEVHGNMYIEVCRTCKPSREYLRLFDVTEKTARNKHGTGRYCHKCNSLLQDSIVHFGERGNLLWPINWSGASKAAKQADVILCLGSSLKVLKKYPWLWQMDRPVSKRAQLYIVNLQWTPKDENACLKINGKCDEVMKLVMSHLGLEIPKYNRARDPIFYHAMRLQNHELSTTSQPFLEEPVVMEDEVKNCENNSNNTVKHETKYLPEEIHYNTNNERESSKSKMLSDFEKNSSIIDHSNKIEEEEVQIISDVEENNWSSNNVESESYSEVTCLDDDDMQQPIENNLEIQQINSAATQITIPEPITGYPAPFFAALPFLSMGLPFPPIYMYPQLSQFLYYPVIQMPATLLTTEPPKPKPKPTCNFCMNNEESITCLYYQKHIESDSLRNDCDIADNIETKLVAENQSDCKLETENEEKPVFDENVPAVTAKNPGWFGKGYKKGIKRKR